MALSLNKFENLGTLSKAEVDQNWTDIEEFSATDASDVIGLTVDDKAITPKSVGDALDWVSVDYDANIELDGSQFAQAEIVLEGDAQLDRPINFDRGTKYVMVKGNNPTERELTFDATYFKGDLPILANVNDTRWYLLCIVAYSDSHYIVTSTRAL